MHIGSVVCPERAPSQSRTHRAVAVRPPYQISGTHPLPIRLHLPPPSFCSRTWSEGVPVLRRGSQAPGRVPLQLARSSGCSSTPLTTPSSRQTPPPLELARRQFSCRRFFLVAAPVWQRHPLSVGGPAASRSSPTGWAARPNLFGHERPPMSSTLPLEPLPPTPVTPAQPERPSDGGWRVSRRRRRLADHQSGSGAAASRPHLRRNPFTHVVLSRFRFPPAALVPAALRPALCATPPACCGLSRVRPSQRGETTSPEIYVGGLAVGTGKGGGEGAAGGGAR